MIEKLRNITEASIRDGIGGQFGFTLPGDPRLEILQIKLDEAIDHINNLEEKLLSPEDL